MREMKDSGIEWIGNIPADWNVTKIKYLFSSGKGLSITKADLEDNGLPVISYGQIHSKENTNTDIKDSLIRFVDNKYEVFKQCKVNQYDFVFADTSEDYDGCGNCCYKRDNSTLYAGYHSIVLHSFKERDNRFLAYLFKTDSWRKQLRETASGVKVFSITQKKLINTSVILPPENQRIIIADFLDQKCSEIDALTADIQAQIETLEEYKKSVITEAVTKGIDPNVEMKDSGVKWIGNIPEKWAVPKILYCLKMPITDGPHTTPALYDEGIPFVSAEAVSFGRGSIDFTHIRGYISNEFYRECCKKYIPSIGDIFMIKSGATTGKVSIVDTDKIFTIWSPLAVFRTNSSILKEKYLFYVLQSDYIQKQIQTRWSYGTQENIGMRVLEKLKITLPPINTQTEIADFLDQKCSEIDQTISEKQQQLETLAEYKKSLIYEYVTGKKEVA